MTPSTPKPTPITSPRSRQALIVGSMVCVFFLALAFIGYRWMQNEALAVLTSFSGETERDTRDTAEQWAAAENNQEFNDGDGARTSESATARFRLLNGAKLKLKPSSQIVIDPLASSNAGDEDDSI